MALYKVPAFKDCDEFLQSVAFQRGKLLPGGIGDAKSAARVVLHDWHNGKIAYYTMPPKRDGSVHAGASILPSFSEAFNAEKVCPLLFVAFGKTKRLKQQHDVSVVVQSSCQIPFSCSRSNSIFAGRRPSSQLYVV